MNQSDVDLGRRVHQEVPYEAVEERSRCGSPTIEKRPQLRITGLIHGVEQCTEDTSLALQYSGNAASCLNSQVEALQNTQTHLVVVVDNERVLRLRLARGRKERRNDVAPR